MVKPAAEESEAEVTAVAARDLERARRFAAKHKIPTAYGSYSQLLADPSIDAIYIAVPNGLHGRWTKAALEAGKHVLSRSLSLPTPRKRPRSPMLLGTRAWS